MATRNEKTTVRVITLAPLPRSQLRGGELRGCLCGRRGRERLVVLLDGVGGRRLGRCFDRCHRAPGHHGKGGDGLPKSPFHLGMYVSGVGNPPARERLVAQREFLCVAQSRPQICAEVSNSINGQLSLRQLRRIGCGGRKRPTGVVWRQRDRGRARHVTSRPLEEKVVAVCFGQQAKSVDALRGGQSRPDIKQIVDGEAIYPSPPWACSVVNIIDSPSPQATMGLGAAALRCSATGGVAWTRAFAHGRFVTLELDDKQELATNAPTEHPAQRVAGGENWHGRGQLPPPPAWRIRAGRSDSSRR